MTEITKAEREELLSSMHRWHGGHWLHPEHPIYKQVCDALPRLLRALDAAEAERDAAFGELKLMEMKVVTCGVAATHPDPLLTATKECYAKTWNSPQAEEVRALRAERDAAESLAWDALGRPDGTHDDSNVQRLCAAYGAGKAKLAAAEAEANRAKSELDGVMVSVDKWFDDDDERLDDNPATRAANAREVALKWGDEAWGIAGKLTEENAALKAKLAALVAAVEYAVDFVNHSACMPMCGLYRTPPTECTCGIDGIRAAIAVAKEPSPADLVRATQDGPHPAVEAKRNPELKATRVPRGKP